MNSDIVSLTIDALWLVLILSAPPIIVASVAGLLVAVIQAATQIQEQTLQYTIKFFAIVVTLFITASLLASSLYRFSDRVFSEFPMMVRR
ncbi:type III secretion system export apparatus subunit SctS [Sphingomonas sp. 1P06PA]|uniref:type III secretion system export apparatus subunit SctS n=1 Tax=Sphingomonas sp. 1P06PA TaxID=554121 RepID=UPI0039A6466B